MSSHVWGILCYVGTSINILTLFFTSKYRNNHHESANLEWNSVYSLLCLGKNKYPYILKLCLKIYAFYFYTQNFHMLK